MSIWKHYSLTSQLSFEDSVLYQVSLKVFTPTAVTELSSITVNVSLNGLHISHGADYVLKCEP